MLWYCWPVDQTSLYPTASLLNEWTFSWCEGLSGTGFSHCPSSPSPWDSSPCQYLHEDNSVLKKSNQPDGTGTWSHMLRWQWTPHTCSERFADFWHTRGKKCQMLEFLDPWPDCNRSEWMNEDRASTVRSCPHYVLAVSSNTMCSSLVIACVMQGNAENGAPT